MSETATAPVAVVTGGNAGIGLAITRRFASQGYRLALCGRDATSLTAVHDELEKVAPDVLVMQFDLLDPDSGPALIEATLERYGRVDVLVNNAGHVALGAIEQLTESDLRQMWAVNCEATFLTTRAVWPTMRQQGGGTIINLSSQSSIDPFPGLGVYGACKAWVNQFTRVTANEGRPFHIRAFALALGAVETRLLRGLFKDFPIDQTLAPEDIAELVFSLTTPAFQHASGQTISVSR